MFLNIASSFLVDLGPRTFHWQRMVTPCVLDSYLSVFRSLASQLESKLQKVCFALDIGLLFGRCTNRFGGQAE